MLSKLYHYKSASTQTKADLNFHMSILNEYYKTKGIEAECELNNSKGTLGAFFTVILNGERRFVKVHLQTSPGKACQIKEISILKYLYQDKLNIESVAIDTDDCSMEYLVMDELERITDAISIDEMKDHIKYYSDKLQNGILKAHINFSIHEIINEAESALICLNQSNFFTVDIIKETENSIGRIKKGISMSDTIICHGDLSNANIMKKGNELIVLDWEDAFWGCPEYDLMYWLTFFDQRKYYNKCIFEKHGLKNELNKDLMITIVLLKCYLSYLSKSYLYDKVSFNDRMVEILSLFQ